MSYIFFCAPFLRRLKAEKPAFFRKILPGLFIFTGVFKAQNTEKWGQNRLKSPFFLQNSIDFSILYHKFDKSCNKLYFANSFGARLKF